MSEHKVAAVSGPVDYSLFAPTPSLPVIDEDASFEQCQEWGFIVELLNDILAERTRVSTSCRVRATRAITLSSIRPPTPSRAPH